MRITKKPKEAKNPEQTNKETTDQLEKKKEVETKKYKIKNYLNETWLFKFIDCVIHYLKPL